MKSITKMVKGKKVTFEFYREGNFFYKTECGFTFPVPIDDIGTATLLNTDKALFFMRWIRKHKETIQEAVEYAAQGMANTIRQEADKEIVGKIIEDARGGY